MASLVLLMSACMDLDMPDEPNDPQSTGPKQLPGPLLYSPADHAKATIMSVLFSWGRCDTLERYQLQIGTVEGTEFHPHIDTVLYATATRMQLSHEDLGSLLVWRVRGVISGDSCTAWSTQRRLEVRDRISLTIDIENLVCNYRTTGDLGIEVGDNLWEVDGLTFYTPEIEQNVRRYWRVYYRLLTSWPVSIHARDSVAVELQYSEDRRSILRTTIRIHGAYTEFTPAQGRPSLRRQYSRQMQLVLGEISEVSDDAYSFTVRGSAAEEAIINFTDEFRLSSDIWVEESGTWNTTQTQESTLRYHEVSASTILRLRF